MEAQTITTIVPDALCVDLSITEKTVQDVFRWVDVLQLQYQAHMLQRILEVAATIAAAAAPADAWTIRMGAHATRFYTLFHATGAEAVDHALVNIVAEALPHIPLTAMTTPGIPFGIIMACQLPATSMSPILPRQVMHELRQVLSLSIVRMNLDSQLYAWPASGIFPAAFQQTLPQGSLVSNALEAVLPTKASLLHVSLHQETQQTLSGGVETKQVVWCFNCRGVPIAATKLRLPSHHGAIAFWSKQEDRAWSLEQLEKLKQAAEHIETRGGLDQDQPPTLLYNPLQDEDSLTSKAFTKCQAIVSSSHACTTVIQQFVTEFWAQVAPGLNQAHHAALANIVVAQFLRFDKLNPLMKKLPSLLLNAAASMFPEDTGPIVPPPLRGMIISPDTATAATQDTMDTEQWTWHSGILAPHVTLGLRMLLTPLMHGGYLQAAFNVLNEACFLGPAGKPCFNTIQEHLRTSQDSLEQKLQFILMQLHQVLDPHAAARDVLFQQDAFTPGIQAALQALLQQYIGVGYFTFLVESATGSQDLLQNGEFCAQASRAMDDMLWDQQQLPRSLVSGAARFHAFVTGIRRFLQRPEAKPLWDMEVQAPPPFFQQHFARLWVLHHGNTVTAVAGILDLLLFLMPSKMYQCTLARVLFTSVLVTFSRQRKAVAEFFLYKSSDKSSNGRLKRTLTELMKAPTFDGIFKLYLKLKTLVYHSDAMRTMSVLHGMVKSQAAFLQHFSPAAGLSLHVGSETVALRKAGNRRFPFDSDYMANKEVRDANHLAQYIYRELLLRVLFLMDMHGFQSFRGRCIKKIYQNLVVGTMYVDEALLKKRSNVLHTVPSATLEQQSRILPLSSLEGTVPIVTAGHAKAFTELPGKPVIRGAEACRAELTSLTSEALRLVEEEAHGVQGLQEQCTRTPVAFTPARGVLATPHLNGQAMITPFREQVAGDEEEEDAAEIEPSPKRQRIPTDQGSEHTPSRGTASSIASDSPMATAQAFDTFMTPNVSWQADDTGEARLLAPQMNTPSLPSSFADSEDEAQDAWLASANTPRVTEPVENTPRAQALIQQHHAVNPEFFQAATPRPSATPQIPQQTTPSLHSVSTPKASDSDGHSMTFDDGDEDLDGEFDDDEDEDLLFSGTMDEEGEEEEDDIPQVSEFPDIEEEEDEQAYEPEFMAPPAQSIAAAFMSGKHSQVTQAIPQEEPDSDEEDASAPEMDRACTKTLQGEYVKLINPQSFKVKKVNQRLEMQRDKREKIMVNTKSQAWRVNVKKDVKNAAVLDKDFVFNGLKEDGFPEAPSPVYPDVPHDLQFYRHFVSFNSGLENVPDEDRKRKYIETLRKVKAKALSMAHRAKHLVCDNVHIDDMEFAVHGGSLTNLMTPYMQMSVPSLVGLTAPQPWYTQLGTPLLLPMHASGEEVPMYGAFLRGNHPTIRYVQQVLASRELQGWGLDGSLRLSTVRWVRDASGNLISRPARLATMPELFTCLDGTSDVPIMKNACAGFGQHSPTLFAALQTEAVRQAVLLVTGNTLGAQEMCNVMMAVTRLLYAETSEASLTRLHRDMQGMMMEHTVYASDADRKQMHERANPMVWDMFRGSLLNKLSTTAYEIPRRWNSVINSTFHGVDVLYESAKKVKELPKYVQAMVEEAAHFHSVSV